MTCCVWPLESGVLAAAGIARCRARRRSHGVPGDAPRPGRRPQCAGHRHHRRRHPADRASPAASVRTSSRSATPGRRRSLPRSDLSLAHTQIAAFVAAALAIAMFCNAAAEALLLPLFVQWSCCSLRPDRAGARAAAGRRGRDERLRRRRGRSAGSGGARGGRRRPRLRRARRSIGLGGGSSIDVAKLVALLAARRRGRCRTSMASASPAGPRLPLLLGADHRRHRLGGDADLDRHHRRDEKKGVVSPLLLPDIGAARPGPDARPAAARHRRHRHRRHGARHRGLCLDERQQQSAVAHARLRGAAAARPQHPHGRAGRRRSRGARRDAARLHAGRPGLRQFAGRRRARAGLSDRRPFPRPAWALERAGAAACAALQRDRRRAPPMPSSRRTLFPELAESPKRTGRAFARRSPALARRSACSRACATSASAGRPAHAGARTR